MEEQWRSWKKSEDGEETQSNFSGESRRTKVGLDFLDDMGEEGVDHELEEKIAADRKRKRVAEVKVVRRGLLGTAGWEWREKEGREEKRWKRMTGGFERGKDGKLGWKEGRRRFRCRRISGWGWRRGDRR